MPTFLESSVEIDDLVKFLKINLQFKDFYKKILSQRIINHAAQERGITVTLEEIQAEANRMRHEKRLEKASDTMAWLADQMITPEDWEEGIRDRLLSEKMAEYLFAKDVEKLFVQNRLNFDQISIYQILVYDEGLAQEIFYQIEEKEISFYEAANLYDLDDKRRLRFGYEGPIDRWKLKPDIAAVVFGAKLGEVIGPLPIEQGYYLIMVEEFIPAELTPQRYQKILDGMFQEWLTSELNYMLHSQTP